MGYNVAKIGPAGCQEKARCSKAKEKGYIYVDTGSHVQRSCDSFSG